MSFYSVLVLSPSSTPLTYFLIDPTFSVGTIHRKKNHIDKAHDCFTKSLAIKKQHYVVNHISIAETLHELAKTISLGEKFLEAISTYEAALLIYEKRLGPHKITASILDSISTVFQRKRST